LKLIMLTLGVGITPLRCDRVLTIKSSTQVKMVSGKRIVQFIKR
jgi:hypothetical protein